MSFTSAETYLFLLGMEFVFIRYGIRPNKARGAYESFGREIYQDKRKKRATVTKPKKVRKIRFQF